MRFDDEEDILETECEICGRSDGHEPDCILSENCEIAQDDKLEE